MPRNNELGTLRRSQVITTFGPGAIIDFRVGDAAVSAVAAGIDQWDERSKTQGLAHPQSIYEPRLQEKLGIQGFRLPPVTPEIAPGVPSPNADTLVGVRFPSWLQCPRCKIIQPSNRWGGDPGNPALYCAPCSADAGGRHKVYVVPVRFIMACPNGHLDEFPWDYWVGHKEGCTTRNKRLKLEGGETAGLAGYILSCPECGQQRPMEGCFAEDAITFRCSGKTPWLAAKNQNCDQKPRVLQRGASNLYFPLIESALSIPPWSDAIQKKLGPFWAELRNMLEEKRAQAVDLFKLHEKLGMSKEALLEEINNRIAMLDAPAQTSLRWEEYCQFTKHTKQFGEQTEFEIRPQAAPPELARWFKQIVRVTRLREVRALIGFSRIYPPSGEGDARLAKIQVEKRNWLPAVENRGEGIFIQLNPKALDEWESHLEVIARAEKIDKTYKKLWQDRHKTSDDPPRTITARFILVHSLAHALMRQLSLDCGYSSASLRERLYVANGEWDMAGLLIYTSAPDSDGTLGGLVRQAEARNLVRVFEGAVRGLTWCSSDPLCLEGVNSLSHPLNGAACHACLLAPETSCEEFNSLLDRGLLIGTTMQPGLGFFRDFIGMED